MPIARGNIGRSFPVSNGSKSFGQFTHNKQPTYVHVDLSGVTPFNVVNLFTIKGTFVDRTNATSGGMAYFYDLDDGGYNAYEVGTGNAWSITVAGAVVTVVRISSTGVSVTMYAA